MTPPTAPSLPVSTAESLRLSVFRLARRMRAERSVEAIGDSQFAVMSHLTKHGPRPVGALAEWERVSAPAMTNLINGLAAAGHVRRLDHPDDRRLVLVEVTAAGRQIVDETRQRRTEWLEAGFDGLGPDDLRALRRAAEIMTELALR